MMAVTVLIVMTENLFPIATNEEIAEQGADADADEDGGVGVVVDENPNFVGLSGDLFPGFLVKFLAAIDQIAHAVSGIMIGVFSGSCGGRYPIARGVCGFLDIGFYGVQWIAHMMVLILD